MEKKQKQKQQLLENNSKNMLNSERPSPATVIKIMIIMKYKFSRRQSIFFSFYNSFLGWILLNSCKQRHGWLLFIPPWYFANTKTDGQDVGKGKILK